MKYLVMECHQAYAVLMDEESRFVNAANLSYTVGQTVTDPVLLDDMQPDRISLITHSIAVKITAAAACLALIFTGGYTYYSRNFTTSSVVVISSGADIEMHLNSRGQVIALESSSPDGQEIIERYNQTHKSGGSQSDVATALIEFQLEEGIISSGDTVSVYVEASDENTSDSLKADLENDLPKVKIDVKTIDKLDHGAGSPATPPTPEIHSDVLPVTTAVHQKTTVNAPGTTVSAAAAKPEEPHRTEAVTPVPQPGGHTTPVTEPAAPVTEPVRPEPPAERTTEAAPPPPPAHSTRPAPPTHTKPAQETVPVQTTHTEPVIVQTTPAEPPVPEPATAAPAELPATELPTTPAVTLPEPGRNLHHAEISTEHLPEEPELPTE